MSKPEYRIEFDGKIPSPNDDGKEWHLYRIVDITTNASSSPIQSEGTKTSIRAKVAQIMIERSNSLQLVGSGNKRKKSISLGSRPEMKRI